MSLVDASTGELVDIADAEEARHIIAETSAAIAHMNAYTGRVVDLIVEANDRRVWVAEGLGSWDELVEREGWRWKPLTSGERAATAELFRQKGMSFRAIGVVLASSPQTIRRDVDGEFTSDHSNVPNGTRSTPTKQEVTDDSDPIEGDAAGYGDGPLGHDEGETADEEASVQEAAGADEGAQATPVPPAALSHPDASPAHQDEGAAPILPVDGGTAPSAAPSVSPEPEGIDERDVWTWVKRVGAIPAMFPADQVRDVASPELLETIADLGRRITDWSDACSARTLRVVQGGAP